jgi:hypothetical protein
MRCLYSYKISEIGSLEFGQIYITSKRKMFPMEVWAPRVLNDEIADKFYELVFITNLMHNFFIL